MDRHSTSKSSMSGVLKPQNSNVSAGPSRMSSIPRYKLGESVIKKRSSAEKMNRISRATLKMTPCKVTTSKLNNCLSLAKSSRSSTDTIRSSLGGKGMAKGWSLSDPSFKTKSIDLVIEFLVNNKCEYSFNRNMLRAPTKKDFEIIFNFIYKKLNPKYNMPSRFEDHIPKLLKNLKYPVQMPKSSFLNVGSPHTWPSVLAMLVWLTDLVTFDMVDCSSIIFSKDFDEDIDYLQLKLFSLVSTYHCEENEQKQYFHEFQDTVEKGRNISPEEFEELQAEEGRLLNEIDNLGGAKEKLHTFQRQYEELCQDKEKLLKFNNELKMHLSAKDSERSHLDQQLQKLVEEYQQIEERIERLETLKSSQHFSLSEWRGFKNNAEEVANQVNYLQIEKQTLNEQMWSLEMETSKARKSLSEAVLTYNTLASQLQIEGLKELHPVTVEQERMSRDTILPTIKAEKKKIKDKGHELHNSLLAFKKDKVKIKESVDEKESNRHKLNCKIKRLEDEVDCLKKDISEEAKEMQRERERVGEMVSQARRFPKVNLYEKQRQLEQAKKDFETLKSKDKEIREKSVVSMVQRRKLIEDTLETRNILLKEHETRMQNTMTTHLNKCKDIFVSLKQVE